ncbi:LysR family transcriptional regulator [Ruegeria arenilitoris]|uniref:LysR family transcriptional regulator n=1 Tax=Ruegeria arenilitoris TaxID=1173585 RepID=UPI00147FEB2E|nr:LysR family transcriptional regulator [Ruegeria arenilitoris]
MIKVGRPILPSISALRALEALDRLGSASAVAEEMALTQSAISRQLQTLETLLGADLVRRDRKRLMLTKAGQDYVQQIRPALSQIAQAALKLHVAPVGGTINLAILPTFGMRWLVPRLPDFARLHPDVTINMSTRLRPFNFASEPFDAALHFGEPDWPGTDRLLLQMERVLPVCAPELLPNGTPAAPKDLLKLPLLHIQTRPKAWQEWFAQMGVDAPHPLPGTVHDQFSTINQAALHGLGVALIPNYVVEQDLATGKLIAAFPKAVDTLGSYYLVWPREKSENHSLRQFRHWLASQAQTEDALPR